MSATILTSIVLAASSSFTAPAPRMIHEAPARAWVTLDAPTKLVNRQAIGIGAAAGRFDKLELVASKGTTVVNKIAIQLTNGKSETIKLGDTINARNPTLTVDLETAPHSIAKIVVFGNGSAHSAYEVFAI